MENTSAINFSVNYKLNETYQKPQEDDKNKKILEKYDSDGNGTLSFSELIKYKEDQIEQLNKLEDENEIISRYQQYQKELEAVENAYREEIERPIPKLKGIN